MIKRIALIIILLALTVSAQDKVSVPPEPLSPIPLTSAESQPLRDALTNEQIAQLALAKAQAEKRLAFYEICDKRNLKPAEWEVRPDGLGGYVAVRKEIQKKGESIK